jgi:hypothetical protein
VVASVTLGVIRSSSPTKSPPEPVPSWPAAGETGARSAAAGETGATAPAPAGDTGDTWAAGDTSDIWAAGEVGGTAAAGEVGMAARWAGDPDGETGDAEAAR